MQVVFSLFIICMLLPSSSYSPDRYFFSIFKFVIVFFLRSTPTFRLFSKYDVLKFHTEEMFLSLGACGEMTSDFEWRLLQLPVCR